MFLLDAVCPFLSENNLRCVPLSEAYLETLDRFKLHQMGILKFRTERVNSTFIFNRS